MSGWIKAAVFVAVLAVSLPVCAGDFVVSGGSGGGGGAAQYGSTKANYASGGGSGGGAAVGAGVGGGAGGAGGIGANYSSTGASGGAAVNNASNTNNLYGGNGNAGTGSAIGNGNPTGGTADNTHMFSGVDDGMPGVTGVDATGTGGAGGAGGSADITLDLDDTANFDVTNDSLKMLGGNGGNSGKGFDGTLGGNPVTYVAGAGGDGGLAKVTLTSATRESVDINQAMEITGGTSGSGYSSDNASNALSGKGGDAVVVADVDLVFKADLTMTAGSRGQHIYSATNGGNASFTGETVTLDNAQIVTKNGDADTSLSDGKIVFAAETLAAGAGGGTFLGNGSRNGAYEVTIGDLKAVDGNFTANFTYRKPGEVTITGDIWVGKGKTFEARGTYEVQGKVRTANNVNLYMDLKGKTIEISLDKDYDSSLAMITGNHNTSVDANTKVTIKTDADGLALLNTALESSVGVVVIAGVTLPSDKTSIDIVDSSDTLLKTITIDKNGKVEGKDDPGPGPGPGPSGEVYQKLAAMGGSTAYLTADLVSNLDLHSGRFSADTSTPAGEFFARLQNQLSFDNPGDMFDITVGGANISGSLADDGVRSVLGGNTVAGVTQLSTHTGLQVMDKLTTRSYGNTTLANNVYSTFGSDTAMASAILNRDYLNLFWVGGFGQWEDADRKGDFNGYKYESYGFMLGYDRAFGPIIAGASFAYQNGDYEDKNAVSHNSEIQSYSASLYATYNHCTGFFGTLLGGYTYSDNDIEELYSTNFRAKEDYHTNTWYGGAKVGYQARLGKFTLTPSVGLSYIESKSSSHNTGVNGVDLIAVGKIKQDTWMIPVELRADYDIEVNACSRINLNANVGYTYTTDADAADGYAHWVGGTGGALRTTGRNSGHDTFNIGAGVRAYINRFDVGVNYDYYAKSKSDTHRVMATMGVSF